MSPSPPVVWVVAGAETAARWVHALRKEGLAAGALPWSAPRALAWEGFRDPRPALVLLTSRRAADVLPPGAGTGIRAACVGASTAEAARARGFEPVFVGEAGGAALAATILAAPGVPPRVVFLAGADVRHEAVEALEGGGVIVETLPVYEMAPCEGFDGRVRDAPEPAAVALGSPRAAEALHAALGRIDRSLPATAVCGVLGAVTAERATALFDRYVAVAERTDPEGLAGALRAVLPRSTPDGARP